jgi:multiple sugar transport system permease protein
MAIVRGSQARLRGTRRLMTVLLGLFLLYTFLPLFYVIVSSTKDDTALFSSFGLWFADSLHLLGNLRDVFSFQNGVFLSWLGNTALYAGASALGSALLASIAGYAFAKFSFPGRKGLFALILGSTMVPRTALVIPVFLLLSEIGLVDTPLAVILPSLVFPLGVYLMRVYVEQSVPDELLDAARIDGAGEIRIFASVVFRIIVPAFVTVLLLSFVQTWNNYFLPLVVLSTPKLFPVTVGLASWYQQASAGSGARALFSLVMTGALVSIIPVTVAFLSLQRFWQDGLTTGGVK